MVARPKQAAAVALRRAVAFAHAVDRLGERPPARLAGEATLVHPKDGFAAAQRVVLDAHPAMVIRALRRRRAPRAHLHRARLFDEKLGAPRRTFPRLQKPEFRQEQVSDKTLVGHVRPLVRCLSRQTQTTDLRAERGPPLNPLTHL